MSLRSLQSHSHALEPDLFGKAPAWPQGLRYRPEFISSAEEGELIAAFQKLPLAPFQFGAFEGKRRVASFDFHYDFGDQRLHKAEAIPEFIRPVITRVEQFGELEQGAIRHVLFPSMKLAQASAGTAISPPLTWCSACRSHRLAGSASGAR